MGATAGRKDVRTRAGRSTPPPPKKPRKPPARPNAPDEPLPIQDRSTNAKADLVFTAKAMQERKDGLVDWSQDELLRECEVGFQVKKRQFIKRRIKELQAEEQDLTENIIAALEASGLNEVGVEGYKVVRHQKKTVSLTGDGLLSVGVDPTLIAQATKITTPWSLRISGGEEKGGEDE